MNAKTIRVFIADDHPIVRQGLEILINAQPDMCLAGQAANGTEAIARIVAAPPDVVVMDLMMPETNGLTAIRELRAAGLDTYILLLTSYPEDEMVMATVEAGANGVILKDSQPEALLDAIRAVAHGENALHPIIVQRLIKRLRQASGSPAPTDQLTRREIEVLKCLAPGSSNQEIAARLGISTRTVTTHVRNILKKLELENRTQAALYAVEKGYAAPTTR